jgi:transposase
MEDVSALLARWQITPADARAQIYRAKTPRERERWHALWLLSRGWPAAQVAQALERDAHTIGEWLTAFARGSASSSGLRAKRWLPPALQPEQQAALKTVVQSAPAQVGVPLANWTWRGVQRFLRDQSGLELSRSSCLRWLHRLDFTWKRPKKRLLKADAKKRAAFVRHYATLVAEAGQSGAKHFFVDEAHFRAEADLRGKWVQRGQPALVDSVSPRRAEKVTYYSAICLETGEVEALALDGYSSTEASVTFLQQLRAKYRESLVVFWDNSPTHGGDALRAYLRTPDLRIHLVRLPAYSPDYNADEAIWAWARAEVTANTCLGTKAAVRERVDAFFVSLHQRKEEVKRRCRSALQAEATALAAM